MAKRDAGRLDKNFDISMKINKDGLRFYDAESFDVYGVKMIDGKYRRMRAEDAAEITENILMISSETAGGRVRFATDSPRIAIYAEYVSVSKVSNYSLSSTMGFDIYSNERFVGVFVPPLDAIDSYESIINTPFSDGKVHEYTINFPICSEVRRLFIGVNEDSEISCANAYKIPVPVVFYGSSITQGACASHPGNAYANMVCRALDCDFVNLGFWGNAKGDDGMARYIANMKMSAFVYDYDHNAPSVEFLERTHEKMFRTVREAQPELPIIIISAPTPYPKEVDYLREKVIYQTYKNACNMGDKNIYFLSGLQIIAPVRDVALADNIHPADIGFAEMAKQIIPILKNVL